jgi:hypothetical protein
MKRVLVVPVAVVALMVAVGPATAAEEIEVGLAECFGVGSGERTVPAGSTVVLSYGWTDTSRALVRRFLRLRARQQAWTASRSPTLAASGAQSGSIRLGADR